MANKNRTEVKAAIQSQAAVVGETEYKQLLDNDFAESVLFRKDVSSSVVATDNAPSVNFTDIDYISLDLNTPPVNDFTITISGVQQGEIKFLKVTKGVTDNVSFSGAIDISIESAFITSQTEVLYRLTNKDGTDIFVEPIIKQLSVGAWQTPSYNANFSAGTPPLQYRLAYGKLEFQGSMSSTVTSGTAFVLPAAYRPNNQAQAPFYISSSILFFEIDTSGNVFSTGSAWSSVSFNHFNAIMIID